MSILRCGQKKVWLDPTRQTEVTAAKTSAFKSIYFVFAHGFFFKNPFATPNFLFVLVASCFVRVHLLLARHFSPVSRAFSVGLLFLSCSLSCRIFICAPTDTTHTHKPGADIRKLIGEGIIKRKWNWGERPTEKYDAIYSRGAPANRPPLKHRQPR